MIFISYGRLLSILDDDSIKYRHEIAMIDTWSLIDSFYRLKTLLDKITGIKKNLPWFQIFFRNIKNVEDIRHFLQHYNERIDYLVKTNKPILGYLVWLEIHSNTRIAIQLLCPGRIKLGKLNMINPIGKIFRNRIDHITFS